MDVLVADAVLYQEAMLRLAKRKKLSHARIWYASSPVILPGLTRVLLTH